ncbi:MAG: nucleotidyltransferase domain-containing protein [Candidatus Pacebacteria bacterium]|nr:nucleotidyltransferase domain-containing protein [Candidatus Paceibacterota bacterium]
MRERLANFRRVFENLQKEHPELIGVTLYGSQTKGYADENSDIDGYVVMDFNVAKANHMSRSELSILVRSAMTQELGVSSSHLHLIPHMVTREGISNLKTHKLFHLGIGNGLREYREALIRSLESRGTEGEEDWQRIVGDLILHENYTFSDGLTERRMELYPMTLKQARAYFLPERREEEFTSDS